MGYELSLSSEFGYVIFVIGLSHIMNIYLMINVSIARKKYNVQYPKLYAEGSSSEAQKFNCVQRAHQNTLEGFAAIQILMILNGLVSPINSAAFGFIWVIGRVIYGYGYANGGPSGRMVGGVISHIGDFPLMLMTLFNGLKVAGIL